MKGSNIYLPAVCEARWSEDRLPFEESREASVYKWPSRADNC